MNPTPVLANVSIDHKRLAELEAIVERGLAQFIEVGNALLEIRDLKLYRETHETFEEYCRERWKMSRQRAHQLIDAAGVVQNLSTTVDIHPTSERQVRPISNLSPDQQRYAWAAATATNPNPTAGQVEKIAKEIVGRNLPPISEEELAKIQEEERDRQRHQRISEQFMKFVILLQPTPAMPVEAMAAYLAGYVDVDWCESSLTKNQVRQAALVFQSIAEKWEEKYAKSR
jgi:hypothetical protein